MKRNISLLLSLSACFLISACGNNNQSSEKQEFFDVVDHEFGITKNVTPYEVKDTKTVNDENIFKFHGRHYYDSSTKAEFINFSNSGFEVTFTGTTLEGCFLATNAYNDMYRPYLGVCIDGDYNPDHATPIQLTSTVNSNANGTVGKYSIHPNVVLAHDLPYGEHTIRIYKRNECVFSKVGIQSVSTDGEINNVNAKELAIKMEFYGDSVTCGYGVEASSCYENFSTRTENSMKSFANYAANYLNADASLISIGGYPIYKSKWSEGTNPDNIPDMFSLADVDWNTNPKITWDNSRYIPDVVVIALGANDGSYLEQFTIGSTQYNLCVKHYKERYISFLDTIFNAYPSTQVVISNEILDINPIYETKMDEIVEEYNKNHELAKDILRIRLQAKDLSNDKSLPGNFHPNQTMQHIAGKELANLLKESLNVELNDDGFTF